MWCAAPLSDSRSISTRGINGATGVDEQMQALLEEKGLLEKIAVDLHPNVALSRDPHRCAVLFAGLGVRAGEEFNQAYLAACNFGQLLSKQRKGAGFLQNLLTQRLCSTLHAGCNSAKKLLAGDKVVQAGEDGEEEDEPTVDDQELRTLLEQLLTKLERIKTDPKLEVVLHYLDNEGWLEHGVIIFSQYYDSARWVAEQLAARYREQDQPVGLYAGAALSRLYHEGGSVAVERESLKRQVADYKLRIMVATDAACEGLNLQTLGTLINLDLPWNPTRLEQRIGRIKRFGQKRNKVDMLNLENHNTVDEKVYERLSQRMQDRYNLFGSLPDTISDEWIEEIETLDAELEQYITAQKRATGFDLRYNSTIEPTAKDWRDCSKVLSRRDVAELMAIGWDERGQVVATSYQTSRKPFSLPSSLISLTTVTITFLLS